MKRSIRALAALAIVVIFAFTSCTKRSEPAVKTDHVKEAYRVLAIGKTPNDTSISKSMWAREAATETVGLVIAEDNKLRAELIGYQKINGQGVYTVAMTNKQACQVILRWGWESLTIDSISPGGAQGDVIPANGYKVFTLVGDAKVGKIKVQAVGDCGNSSTLIVNITLAILPITFLESTANYTPTGDQVSIDFRIDHPETIAIFWVQKLQENKTWSTIATCLADDNIKDYHFKIYCSSLRIKE